MNFLAKQRCRQENNALTVRKLLNVLALQEGSPAKTSLPLELNLGTDKSESLSDASTFRQMIGEMLHVASKVRPDNSYSVSYPSCFIQKSTTILRKTEKHVLGYLCGTSKPGVMFRVDANGLVRAYRDADWGSENPTQKSIAGTV